jgi:tyrosine-specific transport protein
MLTERDSKVFGGTMLIAGTSIGAAILAMPIMTGLFGFYGTVAIMLGCWLFMYWTALLILEASLCFPDGASFISMARETLGKTGSVITWVCFLLLFYSLVAAYLSGSGRIIIDSLEGFLHVKLPPFLDILPLLLIFAPFIYFGLSVVDKLNRYLMIAMFLAYAVITLWMLPKANIGYLSYTNWSFSLLSFSVVVTSFGYHVIIPTLVTYLDRDVKRVKKCLFYGSLIPLLIYFLWEMSILGVVPVGGTNGLAEAFMLDMPLAKLLRIHTGHDFIASLARGFSIFAIVTSFLGVAQGLFDFLKDGIKAGTSHKKKFAAFLLTFVPPIIFIIGFESGFIALLEYAGALVSIILGIIPILIVWRLRQSKEHNPKYRAKGNRWALISGIAFFAFVVLLVLLKNLAVIRFDVGNLI